MATITFTQDLNYKERPFGGIEQWHNQNTVNVPSEGANTQRLDAYFRSPLTWAKIETSKNNYNWTPVMAMLNTAIAKRQKVSLGLMSVYHDDEDGVINYDGANSAYPLYLHQEMQAESVKDWKSSMAGGWVPNYNSPKYIDAQRRINASLNNLLETGSSNGIRYKDIINSIDVRGYGNYGEWHNGGIVNQVSEIPSGAHATTASLKAIIDAHTQTLPNFQLSIIMTAFDANWLQHTRTSAEVGYYALTTSNAYGKLGWRRDNWGAGDGTGDTYIDDLLIRNNRTWNGVPLNSLIMKVPDYAPVTGEPMNNTSNSFSELEAQVRKYRAVNFGNGNIPFSPNTTTKNSFRAAANTAGYKLVVPSVNITNTATSLTIATAWRNAGISPTYENWNVVFELVNAANTVVWSGISSFKPRKFLPSTSTTSVTDIFPISIPAATYALRFSVKDPTGYRSPMPLFMQGQASNGTFSLGNVTIGGGTPVNQPPVVNAGADKTITLPTNTVTLTGTASDDNQITSVLWTHVSGSGAISSPSSLSTAVVELTAGTSVFRLTATDNQGLTASDTVSVVVNAQANTPPTVDAGSSQTITLPTSTVTLNGMATDTGGPIASVQWTRFSGSGNITSPNTPTTTVTGLTAGQSIFRFSATDNQGATSIDSVTITVNAAPNAPRKVVAVETLTATYRVVYDDGTSEQITS